jgi:hypothetical protein
MQSISKLRKQLLSEYVRLKKHLKKTTDHVTQIEFFKHGKITQHQCLKVYKNHAEFVADGEKAFIKSLPVSERAILNEQAKKYDPNATSEDCINNLRKLQEANPTKYVTRTFYRNHGRYAESVWSKFFGTFLEFRRQAGIELSRHQHALERGIAKHAAFDHYNQFYKTQVLPYREKYIKHMKPDGYKTMMVASDIHDEECDEFALEVFIDTCRLKQPDIIVLNGDIFDMLEFGRYNIDPRSANVLRRFEFVWERILGALRKVCPNAQIDLIIGNHEHRLLRLIADASPFLKVWLSDVVGMTVNKAFGVDKYQVNIISKADFKVFSKKDLENEMRKNHKIYFDCYAVSHHPDSNLMKVFAGTNGHHHKAFYTSTTNARGGATSWVQTPSLHVKDAEYLEGYPIWDLGFLEVIINVDKKQVVQKIHQVHDHWAVVDGVVYERQK